ncbi:hypothetical protein [Propioniciclava soli]|uniref:hypothetical protein n=1 Tax=Propioniciclava soli TaxID=2775081 RepID=UPI001E61A3C2|nr:hypothetical protein [Propioniciclava soli]
MYNGLLADVVRICTTRETLPQRISGVRVEWAWTNLHAAEVISIRTMRPDELSAVIPRAVDLAAKRMPEDRSQGAALARLTDPNAGAPSPLLVAQVVQKAHQLSDAAHARARHFRNLVLATSAGLLLAALLLMLVGWLQPAALPMCSGDRAVCLLGNSPSSWDVTLIALVGAASGAVAGVVALRRMHEEATPYRVPVALALLKVPSGALMAVLGLLVLRSGMIVALEDVSTAAGLLGGAIVFGLAQELLTGLVDRRGQEVLKAA